MSTPKLPSLADQISADPIPQSSSTDGPKNTDIHFISRCNPERLGNTAPIAYGGCIIAIAVNAAFQTLPTTTKTTQPNDTNLTPSPPSFHLYSVLGAFHGPTKTDRKLYCTVTPTRNTKTFATRRVIASQLQDDNTTTRTCADLFIDFHICEPALLNYDPLPANPTWLTAGPTHPTSTTSQTTALSRLLSAQHITPRQATAFKRMFHMSEHYLEFRHCTLGVSGTNLMGLAPRIPTPQDALSLPEKTTAEWIRTHPDTPHCVLPSEPLNMTALAFFMDQALSFVPLNHDHKGFEDAGACSTLDFALRVFVPRVRMDEWHFRERKTIKGGYGRTFNEGRLWSEKGELVCVMSQACILRPPPPKPVGKLGRGKEGAEAVGVVGDGYGVKAKI